MEMAGTITADAQDDFRNTKYDLVKKHSKDNLKRYLSGSKESASANEMKLILTKYLDKMFENIVYLKAKKDIKSNGYIKDIYRVKSKNTERIYYYSFHDIYHNSYFCSHLPDDKSSIKIFSSMEECALKGAFPCIKCVLGYEK